MFIVVDGLKKGDFKNFQVPIPMNQDIGEVVGYGRMVGYTLHPIYNVCNRRKMQWVHFTEDGVMSVRNSIVDGVHVLFSVLRLRDLCMNDTVEIQPGYLMSGKKEFVVLFENDLELTENMVVRGSELGYSFPKDTHINHSGSYMFNANGTIVPTNEMCANMVRGHTITHERFFGLTKDDVLVKTFEPRQLLDE